MGVPVFYLFFLFSVQVMFGNWYYIFACQSLSGYINFCQFFSVSKFKSGIKKIYVLANFRKSLASK